MRASRCIGERLRITADDVSFGPTALSSSYQLVGNLLPPLAVGAMINVMGKWTQSSGYDALEKTWKPRAIYEQRRFRPQTGEGQREPATLARGEVAPVELEVQEGGVKFVVDVIGRYNPEAVICVGIPFGHTRPQWIVPHGGAVTVDGTARRIFADYR